MKIKIETFKNNEDETFISRLQADLVFKKAQDWFINHLLWAVSNDAIVEISALSESEETEMNAEFQARKNKERT